VRLVVSGASDHAELVVTHNGRPFPREAWNRAELVEHHTTHTFDATAPGRAPFHAAVTAVEGKTTHVEVSLPLRAAGVVAPASPPSTPEPRRALGWGLVGGGSGAVLLGALASWQVLDAKSTIEAHCQASTRSCDPQGLDAADRGRTFEIVAPLAYAVGALVLGAGAYFLVTKHESPRLRGSR
jgi:hypothetical protein